MLASAALPIEAEAGNSTGPAGAVVVVGAERSSTYMDAAAAGASASASTGVQTASSETRTATGCVHVVHSTPTPATRPSTPRHYHSYRESVQLGWLSGE